MAPVSSARLPRRMPRRCKPRGWTSRGTSAAPIWPKPAMTLSRKDRAFVGERSGPVTVPGTQARFGILPRRLDGRDGVSVVAAHSAVHQRTEDAYGVSNSFPTRTSAAPKLRSAKIVALNRWRMYRARPAKNNNAWLVRAGLLEEIKAGRGSLPVWRRNDESRRQWRLSSWPASAQPRSDRCRGQSDRRAGGERQRPSSPRAITCRKRISVCRTDMPLAGGIAPVRQKEPNWLASRQPAGLKASSGCRRCWADPEGATIAAVYPSDPLAAALGAQLFRRCSTQETRPRFSLGEGRV